MSALDIIALPGHPGMFARRVTVEAWQAAGSPPVNSAGRLYAEQKRLWDGWRLHKSGFNPADNPDDETQRLAHVRFVAFDIDPTAERIRRLTAAGFIRPYTYEPWHWELPNVRSYAIVRSIPATASLDLTPIPEEKESESDMKIVRVDGGMIALVGEHTGQVYTQDFGGQAFSRGVNTKAYGEVAGLSQDEVLTLVNEANARGSALVAQVAAVVLSAGSSAPEIAAALAPLIIPAIVNAVTADTGITQEQVQAATEAAVRAVFADAATK